MRFGLKKERVRVECVVEGFFFARRISYHDTIAMRKGTTLRRALKKLGRRCRTDLLAVLESGANPVVMRGGTRVELPDALDEAIDTDDEIAVFQPIVGG